MLVITRYPQEGVLLQLPDGQEIVVVISGRTGNQIRVGFSCSRSISVLRLPNPEVTRAVIDRIEEQNRQLQGEKV